MKKYIIIGGSTIGFVLISGITIPAFSGDTPEQTMNSTHDIEQSNLRTANPEPVGNSANALIPGIVISHETANVFSRRDGIIEDIYKDIGDTVEKNEIIALLLPKGVEGQSYAMIAEKKARKIQAETDLLNTKSVSLEAIDTAEQDLIKAEEKLRVARNKEQAILQQFQTRYDNVEQKHDQAFTTVRDARQAIENILIGSNAYTGIDLRESDILPELGTLSSNHRERYNVVPIYNDLFALEESETLNEMLTKANELFNAMHDLFAATKETAMKNPTQIHILQNSVLAAKEKWQDAVTDFEALKVSEPALYAVFSGEEKYCRSNETLLAEQEITSVRKRLELTESQQQMMIERAEKGVDIAHAILSAQTAESGHREIRSPFSGVISKRFIEVGQMVSTMKPAYELVGVETSLAKNAKTEIKFGLPEELQSLVNIGDTITFFIPDSEEDPYEAVVTRKSPQVDRETRTVTIQAKIPDDISLPHQTNIRVRISEDEQSRYRIPSYVVKRSETGSNYIWVLDSETNLVKKLTITVHSEDGEFAEIIGPITDESKIVLDPPDMFLNRIKDDK